MIDCLSNPAWISPQTDFLLILQNLRVGHLEMFDKFFLSVTVFGEFWFPTLVCAIIYWCIDFRAGVYLFSLEGINVLIAHFFKMIACVYRPWVLDSRIQPSKLAFSYAGGYSFPSGHSAMSSSVIGGMAYLIRRKKILCTLLICLFLLVGFSRMWLGVHTPQDVVCGILTGIILIFLIDRIVTWAEKDKNRYLYLLAVIDIFAILSVIYMCFFNSYRLDYVSGNLLVNPQKTLYNTLVLYSYALGLVNGCYLCRRFFPFNPKDVSVKRRVARGIVGGLIVAVILKSVFSYIVMNIINTKIAVSVMFLMGISVTLVYPLIFRKLKMI